ncbi:S6 family peptidase [Helicobacter pametensis]|uniref:S6 family peptidase n=1 Tax=Helicobacter pametensis TaxID=95149 RepID=UPI0004B60AC4|nr:S6 family peptidase [Helicobacter pametensis]
MLANIADHNFSYQDYLDFGQNKGRFQAGSNFFITSKKGETKHFDISMPDFVGVANWGLTATFVGGSYMVSAMHIYTAFKGSGIRMHSTTYQTRDHVGNEYGQGDVLFVRSDKFITDTYAPTFLEISRQKPLDTSRYTYAARAGQGDAYYQRENGDRVFIQKAGIKTGGLMKYHGIQDGSPRLIYGPDSFFGLATTAGDSGSPIFMWDTQEKQWVMTGSDSAGFNSGKEKRTLYSAYTPSYLDDLIARNTNPTIHLNGSSATWTDQNISTHSSSSLNNAAQNKDIILRGGGTITLSANTDQGHGGIYFDANQTYTITSPIGDGNTPFYWKGGGLHIDSGTVVHWQVKGVAGQKHSGNRPGYKEAPDSLHKIGKGTLSVEVFNGGWLNLGEGKVILNPNDASKPTFENIVMVSGRATLELTEGKSGAFDPNRFFFLFRGGTLDIKGNDLTFSIINASDNGANIINTGSKQAKLIIEKKMLDLIDQPISGSGEFLYHGNIGNNILISKTLENQPTCPWGKPGEPSCYGYGENLLAFDGNILNPSGSIEHINGKLVLQGHPVIHAYLPEGTAQNVRRITGDDIYSTPTRLTQEDWENRTFVLDKIQVSKDTNDSTLILGRNALLLTNLNAKDTQVFFGGSAEIYIDRWDGENVLTSNKGSYIDYRFQQTLTKGVSQKDDSFYFEGNLEGRGSTSIVVSNTVINPLRFGSFEGFDRSKAQKIQFLFDSFGLQGLQDPSILKSVTYSIKLDPTSTFQAKYVSLYGEDQVILDTIPPNSQPNTQIEPQTQAFASFTIENLSLHGKNSIVHGDLLIQPIQGIKNANIPTSITFDSLHSKLHINRGTLTLASQTKLKIDFASTDLKSLSYGIYPLILTEHTINDQRDKTNKDISIFHSQDEHFKLPDFLTPQTLNEDKRIALVFDKAPNTNPPSKDYDWFEQYILDILALKDFSLDYASLDSKLQDVLKVIGENRPIMEAIVASNIHGGEKYFEYFIDFITSQASEGNGGDLDRFASMHTQSVQNIAREGIIITSRLLNNIASFDYYRKSLFALYAKNPYSNLPQKRQTLAFNALAWSDNSLARSDVPSSIARLERRIFQERFQRHGSQRDLQKHHLWITPQGSYFSIGGEYFNAGVSGGYDYIPIARADLFLSIGASLHYAYTEFSQDKLKESGNGVFAGLGMHLAYKNHEFFTNLYGGMLKEDLHFKDYYLSDHPIFSNTFNQLQTTQAKQTNYGLLFQAIYKYGFEFDQKNIKHILKPVGGVEVSHYWIPEGRFDLVTFQAIQATIPTVDLGIEYNLLSSSSQNIFSILAKYNIKNLKSRDMAFGISPLPSNLTQTDMQGAWIELSYSGNYAFNDSWGMDYSLLASMSASRLGYFGISGNIGVNWRF